MPIRCMIRDAIPYYIIAYGVTACAHNLELACIAQNIIIYGFHTRLR